MDILGYEIDIYMVIAVTAGIFVFGIIYLMSGGLSKKKTTKAKKKLKKEKTVKMATTEKQQAAAAGFEEEPQQEPKKTMPVSATEAEQKKIAFEAVVADQEQEKFAVSPIVNAVTAASIQEKAMEAGNEQETPAVLKVQASEVAQDSDEEQNDKGNEDNPLDDIFSMEEEEDSEMANLAASLEDIDVGAVKKLSEEISQMLGGNSSEVPRR